MGATQAELSAAAVQSTLVTIEDLPAEWSRIVSGTRYNSSLREPGKLCGVDYFPVGGPVDFVFLRYGSVGAFLIHSGIGDHDEAIDLSLTERLARIIAQRMAALLP